MTSNGMEKNLLKSSWLFIPLILMIGWLSLSLIEVRKDAGLAKKEVEGLESRIADLKNNNKSIQVYMDGFENPAFLEREAREKLNYKAVGEEVVFVYKDNKGDIVASASEGYGNESFFKKIFDLIAGLVQW
jgi:cell division protein FtsB